MTSALYTRMALAHAQRVVSDPRSTKRAKQAAQRAIAHCEAELGKAGA